MSKKSQDINPSKRHKLENLLDDLSDFVSSDVELAKEYLEEEGVEQDAMIQHNIEMIKKIRAQALLAEGEKKQNWFEKKRQEFRELLKSAPDKVNADLQALQYNFRKLDVNNLDETEMKKLFEDAQFLNYLENEFPDENQNESQ